MTDKLLNFAIDMNNFIQEHALYLPHDAQRIALEYQKTIDGLVENEAKQ